MKRIIKILITVTVLALMLAACAPEPAEVELNISKVIVFNPAAEELAPVGDGTYSVSDMIASQFDAVPEGDAIVCLSDYSKKTVTNKSVLSWQIAQTDVGYVMQGDKIPEEIKDQDVLYIAFADTALLFVSKDLETRPLFESLSLQTDIPFTFTAADGFSWATLDSDDTMSCVIMPVDGSVNVMVPSLKNGGSVRDCIYFVPEHTPGAASAVVQ